MSVYVPVLEGEVRNESVRPMMMMIMMDEMLEQERGDGWVGRVWMKVRKKGVVKGNALSLVGGGDGGFPARQADGEEAKGFGRDKSHCASSYGRETKIRERHHL